MKRCKITHHRNKFIHDPHKYIINNVKRLDETEKYLLINLLQNETHKLLNVFLSGSLLSRKSLYLYPWVKEYKIEKVVQSFEKIICYLRILHQKWNLELEDTLFRFEDYWNLKRFNPQILSEIISSLYRAFSFLYIEKGKTSKRRIKCPNSFDPSRYKQKDYAYLKPVVDLNAYISVHLKDFLCGAYIHGSMATMDYIKGVSDLDTLLILKNDVVMDEKKLLEFENKVIPTLKYFYQIDPLQHHGHMVITELDKSYYPQTYFPLILFDYAVKLSGPQEVTFNERDSTLERKVLLWRMLTNTDKHQLEQGVSNFFGLKYFLSIVQLIPTIFLQAQGEYCYKRDSFKRIRDQYPNLNWAIIDKATSIRNSWIKNYSWQNFMAMPINVNPFFISLVYRKFCNNVPNYIKRELGKNFLDEYCEFCNSLREMACFE